MSREKASRQDQLSIFGEKAKRCKTDRQKIEFFNSTKEAFFIHSNESTYLVNECIPNDLDDAFYVYANMKRLNERELMNLRKLNWIDYPKNFKIFLFDFCILNGDVYSKFFID